ncbi:prohibitin family protein [Candidatus Palauibacter sp.]|uniref:prohibitin family protein n=1 Tax=Candidatus Palauibacter sp. TaxID=3101350 RepID=UPI003AF23B0D
MSKSVKSLRLGTLAAGVAAFFVLLVFVFGFNRVDEYEVAVKRNPVTGAVASRPYTQGLYHSILRSWTNYPLREVQYPAGGQAERLDALTSDQLQIAVDAAYRYRLNPDSAVHLYLTVGNENAVSSFVYNTYRSAIRDAIAEIEASDILSTERTGISARIEALMTSRLSPRGVEITDFFVREVVPPQTIREAIEAKLAREQQVQSEEYQTQVVVEQANQQRAEAEGIRDAQDIIAQSLAGVSGERYLHWRYLEMLGKIGEGTNNMVIAPTEGGVPLFFAPAR